MTRTLTIACDFPHASYQVLDESTGTVILSGETRAQNDIPVPDEPGQYQLRITAAKSNRVLLIDFAVSPTGNAVASSQHATTTTSALSRKRIIRSLTRGFTLPITAISTNQSLIRTLVRRDVLGRYSGSYGGAFWAVLNPLLLMLTYFFVFGIVLNSRFPGDPSRSGFALYYLAGFLPWLAFSEAVGRAPFTMVEHRSFIKKLVFPVEILPVNLVVSGLVTELFGVIIFALALLILRGNLPPTALYFPLILIPQILFTAGVCWFLSALGVFFRDLAQINGFVITVWFFITPICYPEDSLSKFPPLHFNPIYILVRAYRSIFLEAKAPNWYSLGLLTAASLLVFFAGHAWFHKLRKSFADLI